MPIHNADVAESFNKVADLLEISGADPFRVGAYRDAARTIGGLSKSVAELIAEGKKMTDFYGIGKDLAEKIKEIVKTGKLSLLERLEIERRSWGKPRTKLIEAEAVAQAYVEYLKKDQTLKDITIAGSYRRGKETVGDLDILVTVKRGSDIMQRFVDYEDVDQVVSRGKTRSSVVLRTGLQVDLRVVPQVAYGAALHYFTGSKAHNIAVRRMGQKKGLKINEYGVFKNDQRRAGKTEKEVFKQVDLPYIAPELRGDRGEIQTALKKQLPDLIELSDIRGDLHVHTKETDGRDTLQDIVRVAQKKGYAYLAISNHSQNVTVAQGLDRKRLVKQIEKIERLRANMNGFVILKSIEVDILKDGSLDLPDDILKELDVVVGAVHSDFKLSRQKQTERILRAMDNPYFNILAHPSGRLINERDLERLKAAARERGCYMELNAHPDRLDLNEVFCKMAKEMDVKIAISTDAHSTENMDHMRLGILQARRGWLEADDVLNTRSWKDLEKLLERN
ncbi:MAG: PHP domain-containing protein [Desulfobacterales bacterium]|jgi:DNA polymerase (family 10)